MTEAEWEPICRQASRRRRTLLALAVIRNLPQLNDYPVVTSALPFVEMVADLERPTIPHYRQLKSFRLRAQRRLIELDRCGQGNPSVEAVAWLFQMAAASDEHGYFFGFASHLLADHRSMLSSIAAEVFGNPFRPVAFAPAWRSETVVALASTIYDERAFDRLPILADALEEAGCDHADVLTHCRGPGPHARGCWVVDAVLNKV